MGPTVDVNELGKVCLTDAPPELILHVGLEMQLPDRRIFAAGAALRDTDLILIIRLHYHLVFQMSCSFFPVTCTYSLSFIVIIIIIIILW